MTIRRRFPSAFTFLLASAALALGAVACSDSADDAPSSQTDGRGEGGGEDGYTLDNVCDAIAKKSCAAMASCCEKADLAYDEAACEDGGRRACLGEVAKVRAGKLSFDASAVDECIEVLRKSSDKCEMTAQEAAFDFAIRACLRVFPGAIEEGASCSDDNECKPDTSGAMVVSCENGVCHTEPAFEELGEGGDCGVSAVCARGLYCAPDPDYGHGYVCAPAKDLGEACESFDECLSWACEEGTCAPAKKKFIVDAETCSGG